MITCCHNCPDRYPACHDACEKYKAARKKYDEQKAEEKEANLNPYCRNKSHRQIIRETSARRWK